MSDLMAHMAMKQEMCDRYLSMTPEARAAVSKQISEAAEKASKFKKFELVRVCLSPGISLVGGLSRLPHDHKDPKQHLDTRILGWNMYGETEVASHYYDNPHSCEMSSDEKSIRKRKGPDWYPHSTFKPDQDVTYKWELIGFGEDSGPLGRITRARLIAPHIKEGDWYVSYEKPSGYWITRVLNEKQMTLSA